MCELIGIQPLYDPVQVGAYIESGDIQGGVDPTADREFALALATDSTFPWKEGGRKSAVRISMAELVANRLTLK